VEKNMNPSRIWLVLLAAFSPLTAAPVPAPPTLPPGPIGEVMRLRSLLPTTSPLIVLPAILAREGTIELERDVLGEVTVTRIGMVPVAEAREVTEVVKLPDGQLQTRKRIVNVTTYRQVQFEEKVVRPTGKVRKEPVQVKSCRFFVVTRDGKLEALDAAKATVLLKDKTAVLTGNSTEVEPRHLDLIKPGTLYLVLPPPTAPLPPPPPPAPDNGRDS